MRFLTLCIILPALIALVSTKAVQRTHPDVGLDAFELAAKHGYPLEAHEVVTEDGYLLALHRIPHGKDNPSTENRPPILLMHGIASSSADWMNIGPGEALAYLLAERGYDVWMANARGNYFSRAHKNLDADKDKEKFWDFTWNEIGKYDLPANIDYILAQTGYEQLQYVGFSQGTTAFFVMASSRPEYNDKIKLATTLAPAAEMTHMKNPIARALVKYEKLLTNVAKMFGIHEILPKKQEFLDLVLQLCDTGKPTQELCKIVVFAIAGYDREQLDGDMIPLIATNLPSGSSFKQFVHFAQIVNDKEFKQFDYHDEQLNRDHYGSEKPPAYDLGKITAPVALYYGENDWLASDTDAINISKKMPNVVKSIMVDYKAFTHLDFVWAIDVVELLYNDVLDFIDQYK